LGLYHNGLELTLYYNLNKDADENVTTGWVELGYTSDFNFTDKSGKTVIYKKYNKVGTKRGRREITGSLGQLYEKYSDSLFSLCKQNVPVALRGDFDTDGDGVVVESLYLSKVDLDDNNFNAGNTNDSSEVSTSNSFTASDYHFVEI
jgi:hypothetical protein